MASLVDACSHFLHAPFALPAQLDSKWAAFNHAGLARSKQFSRFRRRTGHQRVPILVSYIDKHSGSKPSFRSKVLLTSVEMAFYGLHTFRFRVPLMQTDSCARLEPRLVVS